MISGLRVLRVLAGWRGRERSSRGPLGEFVVRVYDSRARLVEERIADESGSAPREVRRFDEQERLAESTFIASHGGTVHTRYDRFGQIQLEEFRDCEGRLTKRVEFTYQGNDAVVRTFDERGTLLGETRESRHGV